MAGKLRIICIDVGQGDATVIVGPTPHTAILVDAAKAQPVLDVLHEEKVRTISLAVLTHDDSDHIRGFGPVLRTFVEKDGGQVDCVAIDQDRFEASDTYKRTAQLAIDLHENTGTKICRPSTDSLAIRDVLLSARVGRLLYPKPTDVLSAQLRRRPNDGSAILMLEWGAHKALLGADLGQQEWQTLIWDRQEDVRADVLRYPHHGSALDPPRPTRKATPKAKPKAETPALSEAQLLDAVKPSVVVISVGMANTYGHPDPLVVQAIRKRRRGRTRVRLLCTEATYRCTEADGKPPATSPGRAIRCAGSVTIELGGKSIKVDPTPSQHKSVFSGFAGSMKCR